MNLLLEAPQATTAKPKLSEATMQHRCHWLRYPTWGGSAYVSLHPDDASFVLERGWMKIDGIKARVDNVNDFPFIDGSVGVEIHFEGRWTRIHP